jgi:hypothetical protein
VRLHTNITQLVKAGVDLAIIQKNRWILRAGSVQRKSDTLDGRKDLERQLL